MCHGTAHVKDPTVGRERERVRKRQRERETERQRETETEMWGRREQKRNVLLL